jgi:phosphatidylglycerophosphate synthase
MNLTSKRKSLKKVYEPIGILIAKTHITPNGITVISVILGVLSAYFFYNHKPLVAALLLFMSGFFDLMDGVVARETDTSSKFGAVFDWLADKVVDGAVLFAVGMAYSTPTITIIAVIANMLHTFIKPVAYSEIGYQERNKGKINDPLEGVGFFGRPETILTLVVFGVLENFIHGALHIGFQLITILTLISLALRVGYLYKNYHRDYD